MNLYQQRVLNARKEFLRLNKKQEKELLRIYQELAKQLSSEIASCRTSSSEQYLREMEDLVQTFMNELNSKLNNVIKNNIRSSSQISSITSLAYYESITNDVKLRAMFNKSVINTSANTVKKLIQGKYYEDGKTLDQRIWNITRKNAKDIDTLIKVNILRGANARELARQVDKYVHPLKKTEAKTIVSGMSSKVSYQAQRLARTSISHSFAGSTIENAKNNPFNKGVRWNLSASHPKHDICDDYAGKVFKLDEAPLQHCNCLCYFTEENEDIDKAIQELKAWSNGKDNLKLDKWYKENNENNELNDSISDIIKRRKEKFKPAKNIKKAEEFVKDTLGIRNVSYKGCDLITINEWNKGLYESFKKFPELKNNFGFIGECHERNKELKPIARQYYLDELIKNNPQVAKMNIDILEEYADKHTKSLMKKVSVSKNTFAQSWSPTQKPFSDFRGITVNKSWGKDSSTFISALKNNVESKFHPEYCDTIRSVLDHEIGHQLDDLLGIGKIPEVQKLFDDRTRDEITKDISKYSWDNDNSNRYSEMIAESWAEYCNNPNPREIAKTIGKIIEYKYKAKFEL